MDAVGMSLDEIIQKKRTKKPTPGPAGGFRRNTAKQR